MKLLFDENLSPRLVGLLADVYPGSAHVHQCGLGSAEDKVIWQYAKEQGFTSAQIEALLRAAHPIIERFIQQDEESCLVLGLHPKTK